MEIKSATERTAIQYAQEIADLVHQTGPVPYDYQFGTKDLLDRIVKSSLPVANSLFGFDGLSLALDGEELQGILFSFEGQEFRKRKAGLSAVMKDMLTKEEATSEELMGLAERSAHAQWLNPELRPGTYYIHAIAAKPEHRGKQVGGTLIKQALAQAKEQGSRRLELDVMSDNPAVIFYHAQGLEILAETTAPKPRDSGVPPEYRMGMKL